jgi:hypothetical protein
MRPKDFKWIKVIYGNDETLPNFIKRKHPRMGEKKEQYMGIHMRRNEQL